jgi:hypothetical protein
VAGAVYLLKGEQSMKPNIEDVMGRDIPERLNTAIDQLEAGTTWPVVREDLINLYYDLCAREEPNARWMKLEDLLRASLEVADPGENGEPEALLTINGKQVSVSFSSTNLIS